MNSYSGFQLVVCYGMYSLRQHMGVRLVELLHQLTDAAENQHWLD